MSKRITQRINEGCFDIFVNEEKKTVVAHFFPYKTDISVIPDTDSKFGDFPYFVKYYTCKDETTKFSGKAKCLPEDEFIEDIGVRLAMSKALRKYSCYRLKELSRYEKLAEASMNQILSEKHKCLGDIWSLDSDIDSLMSGLPF